MMLMAYVDGETDAETAREIEAALAADATVAARARAMRETGALARAAMSDALHEPVPERLLAAIGPLAPANQRAAVESGFVRFFTGWWPAYAVAAGVAALAIGLGSGAVLPRDPDKLQTVAQSVERNWLDNVVGAYRVYAKTLAKEERLLVDFNAEDIPELQKWLGSRLERDLNIPDFSAHGFIPQGGRLLVIDGRPAAQLLYYSEHGELIGLVIAFSAAHDRTLEFSRRSDVNIFHWRRNGYAYALVGDVAPRLLRELATIASSKLEPT